MQNFARTLRKDGAAMKKKGVIFDLDGTLLDSMHIWDNIGEQYLCSLGIKPREDLNETLKSMSLAQGAAYIQKTYDVEKTSEEIADGVNAIVEHFYIAKVQLKAGAEEFLAYLAEAGVKMCIATATDKYLVEAALNRLGVRKYFSAIFTCSEVGYGKDEPFIYEKAREYLGTQKKDTFVFEDAIHAIETAKKAGFPVVGVCDASEKDQKKVQALSDFYITDLKKAQEVFR